jgi:hypothetical protein
MTYPEDAACSVFQNIRQFIVIDAAEAQESRLYNSDRVL